jgi:effector-binding domain-containing protein
LIIEKEIRMLPRKFTVLVSSLLLLCVAVVQGAQERGIKITEGRLALVIGNGAYQTAPLNNPINDAEDMAAILKKLGFKVILKKNADQRTMEDSIRYFGRQLRNGDVGLFYFAGHGIQVEGRNYLMPVDAKIESESDVKYEAIDAGRILGKMEDAENRLNIVILDACRNNPYARAFRSDQSGLARMDAPTGSMIAYSTAPGEAAAEGPGRNGIFTKYLIQHMMTPNLSIEQVLKRVRIDVARQTNGRQIPWESSSLMGDFYFNPAKTETFEKPSSISSTSENQMKTITARPVTKEISSSDEMQRLLEELPELVPLKEGLPAYYVHVYTPNMPIYDNKMEAQKLLSELRKKIDPNVQINSKPYATLTKYTVFYGPYSSKLEAARMAKKLKDAGYSFFIKLTPNA